MVISVLLMMLLDPKPSLRRLVSPNRPCLAYLEALAPAELARDAGLRLSGHCIITLDSFAAQQAVNKVRESSHWSK